MELESEGTFYLYDKKYRDIHLESLGKKVCSERVKLLSLVDTEEKTRQATLWGHVQNCELCKADYLKLQKYLQEINHLLPVVKPSPEMKARWNKKIAYHTRSRDWREIALGVLSYDLRRPLLWLWAGARDFAWAAVLGTSMAILFYQFILK